ISAAPVEPITIGNDAQNNPRSNFVNPFECAATISPRGAAVDHLNLSRHRNHVAKDPKNPDHDPYKLLNPVKDAIRGENRLSFASRSIKIDNETVSLEDVVWT